LRFAQVRAAEDLRHFLIQHFEAVIGEIFGEWGSHESLTRFDLAMKIVDALDWDEIQERLK